MTEDQDPKGEKATRSKSNILGALLKDPNRVSQAMSDDAGLARQALVLLGAALAFHAVFGLAFGLFGGSDVALMDAVKSPIVALCSLLVCFPSLYVFSCVAGSPLSLSQTFMIGCSCLAMVGLLLLGLAPVAWLFSVSTESAPFVVVLVFIIWIIAMMFTGRYIGKLQANPLLARQAGIKIWFVILTLVTLQMVTCMRPMLIKPDGTWWTAEKKFFMSHFADSMDGKKSSRK